MVNSNTSCIKSVGGTKICANCSNKIVKHGTTKAGKQRYKCKNCNKTVVAYYSYNACLPEINSRIILYIKEGLGIRSIARILKIATTTLLKRIIQIANMVVQPIIQNKKSYEVDELCTFIKQKSNRIWIVYALDKETKEVVSFSVGNRTNLTLKKVINTLFDYAPKVIYTDKLRNYKSLISSAIHKTTRFGTNHIERKNLTLRTHLKRLNRKTICFSRKELFLEAILKIYFWSFSI